MASCARTEILIGLEGIEKLWNTHVLVAGLGGVGGACADALCRAGIGKLTIIDHDDVSRTNINRQLVALNSTIGRPKVEVMAERLLDISPELQLNAKREFIKVEAVDILAEDNDIDYVADCIDSIACKSALVAACLLHKKKIISAMGAGGKMDPAKVTVTSLNQTQGDPLAREMRKALRKLNSPLNYPVVYSTEAVVKKALAHQPVEANEVCDSGRARAVNGAISYMPNIFGLMLAGYVIQDILSNTKS